MAALTAPKRSQVMELHTALFAVGDLYGAEDAHDDAGDVRDSIREILVDLVKKKQTEAEPCWLVARATAYLLTFTAQLRKRDRGAGGSQGPDTSQDCSPRAWP